MESLLLPLDSPLLSDERCLSQIQTMQSGESVIPQSSVVLGPKERASASIREDGRKQSQLWEEMREEMREEGRSGPAGAALRTGEDGGSGRGAPCLSVSRSPSPCLPPPSTSPRQTD